MTDQGPRPIGERALGWLFRPVDAAWLAGFRIAFGALIAVSMQRFLVYGWVDKILVAPRFRFKYWGFEWVEPLSASGMHLLFWVLFGLACATMLGLAFRIVTPLLALGVAYIQLLDVTIYLNHYYLVALLAALLSLSPANRIWSVDALLRAWWRRRRGLEASAATVSAVWHVLFRAQVGIVYTFAGLAKAQSDWLLHGQPLRIWLGANTHLPVLGPLFTLDAVPLVMSWCGFLFDLTIPWWLSFRKTRPWAFLVVLFFHVMTKLLFNIGMFPFIMVCAALVFFSPSWPRALLGTFARIGGLLMRRPSEVPGWLVPPRLPILSTPSGSWVGRRCGVALAALYCALQIALPLRYLAYGGNVLWHEQGMRFSWRVMVRVKGGGTTFVVRDKSTGRVWHVSPREYLTPLQEAEMSSQPDLILQLAHHIREDLEAQGFGPLEIRAESRVTLNGRRSVALIDPTVDLTTIRDGLARADWILPAPETPPPHTRPVL
jgi:hypothetical protein